MGGSVMGLSMATLGRAGGAALGRALDARLLGSGAEPVEAGRVDRFRLTGTGEGAPIARLWGRMRIAGHVIWASRFEEHVARTGGKGGPPKPRVDEYSYTVSLAIGLCEGPITRIGRIWADGVEIGSEDLELRVYEGREDQLPDPKIEAVEGVGAVPAFRGTAYVVIEDLDLGRFGNRVPQFSFEVFRPADIDDPARAEDIARLLRGVAIIPGTGDYSLATTPVHLSEGFGEHQAVNTHTPAGGTDFSVSLDALAEELPNCQSASLVVSWFGDDLRAGSCQIRPKAEQGLFDAEEMPWQVSGVRRPDAVKVPRVADKPIYGGTPTDQAVIEAIQAMNAKSLEVVFYPFILMDQIGGNGLPDPYGGAEQAALPWRGRITTALAPGRAGTSDRTAGATAEVSAFFGHATAADFQLTSDGPVYTGGEDWGLRRFILHCAHLCAQAGGVSAFCIGSELRGLTTIRGAGDSFPAVTALRELAAEVRTVLGPGTKIGYAADWSEYHGYQPGGGTKHFHLDPLWSDPEIDFIGIDNYMPLSDWRDGDDHADASWGSIYDLDYLAGNVAGGEGYDWYYASPDARDRQDRTPIADGDGEPWVWRYKDLEGWWANPHHDRIDGVRQAQPTAWQPRSKPIWFTEIGCAAIDRGTNEPNKFIDPKSSESLLPHHSRGQRDDFIQMQYLRAIHRHFADPDRNPTSDIYGGSMVDSDRMLTWAWDGRPYPWFPAMDDVWSDGGNWMRGHWLNGRSTSRSLASVVTDICRASGIEEIDTSRLFGLVRGYLVEDTLSARAALQPLMLAHGFDAIERGGQLVFQSRDGHPRVSLDPEEMVAVAEDRAALDLSRAADTDLPERVRLGFIETDGDYQARHAEAALPNGEAEAVSLSEIPMALTGNEAQAVTGRWLAEARLARETAQFSLPLSRIGLGAGDVLTVNGQPGMWRIDRVEETSHLALEAVRVAPALHLPTRDSDDQVAATVALSPAPVAGLFLDLPLMSGDEIPHAPHFAATGRPWPGPVALHTSVVDSGYRLSSVQRRAATVGTTLTELEAAPSGRWDRGPALQVRLVQGRLASTSPEAVLAGANLMAIGDGASDHWELFHFAEAELIAPNVWALRRRLRGQAGTDGIMPDSWPIGSRVVLLDGTARQVDLPAEARDLARYYRYGPASKVLPHTSSRTEQRAFRGIGLRPYSVVNLRATRGADGVGLSWIRRTRIGGDSWSGRDVPLHEAEERYAVRVFQSGVLLREAEVTTPSWLYGTAQQASDGATGGLRFEVAQLSEAFGPGPFASVLVAP